VDAAREAGHPGAADRAARDPLTTAEMRVLGYLPTHLSFPAIAGRLNVSRFTVKTQAMAVYRKLGASSRAEAVDRAREIGLLA
jgi:LuxR family maltose regulon positive regulatory protein